MKMKDVVSSEDRRRADSLAREDDRLNRVLDEAVRIETVAARELIRLGSLYDEVVRLSRQSHEYQGTRRFAERRLGLMNALTSQRLGTVPADARAGAAEAFLVEARRRQEYRERMKRAAQGLRQTPREEMSDASEEE